MFENVVVTTTYQDVDVYKSWLRHLVDIKLAKSRHMIAAAEHAAVGWDYVGVTLLPSLLYVRTVSILDEALETYIDDKALTLPKKFRHTLGGRINVLADLGLIANPQDLRDIKDRRNAIAHDSNKSGSYGDLSQVVDTVERTLQSLNFVGARPRTEVYLRRVRREPPIPGADLTHDYTHGVKISGITALTIDGELISEITISDLPWTKSYNSPQSEIQ